MMTAIYKIGLENWGSFFQKIGGPKMSKFWRDFGQLCDLIANISGLEQAVINRKRALQTTLTPVHAHLI